jgi:hypothetical protein
LNILTNFILFVYSTFHQLKLKLKKFRKKILSYYEKVRDKVLLAYQKIKSLFKKVEKYPETIPQPVS